MSHEQAQVSGLATLRMCGGLFLASMPGDHGLDRPLPYTKTSALRPKYVLTRLKLPVFYNNVVVFLR